MMDSVAEEDIGGQEKMVPKSLSCRMTGLMAAAILSAGLAACGGRDPRHIPVVEPNDTALSCQALSALIANNNYRIESLFAEHKRASENNVAHTTYT